ncbi:MAG: M3 family metallopeptidase, partial [Paracoccaceae bacterium]|nr:M3 family metallopeptidase [Paracoccaceae bacterium]
MFQLSFPLYDINDDSGSKDLGNLPEWDLSDLYSSQDAPELAHDLKWLEGECATFATDFEGKLAQLDAQAMLDCVLRKERINAVSGRIMSFAGLRYYQLTIDDDRTKFMSDMQEKITNFTTPLVFFTLELNRIDDAALQRLLDSNSALARYQPVFDRIRALKPYQLSDELEKFLHDLGVVDDAWERLFDETIAGLTFKIDCQDLNIEGTLNMLTDPDRDEREKGAVELARVFTENIKIFARVHNTQTKEKEILDRWRGMPTPQMGRHLSNHVEPEVVKALRNAVVAAYPKLSHRYYQLKRKWLGLDVMQIWDRNAPLPMENSRIVRWGEAQKTVLKAYGDFDPRMADLATPFFSKGWIDAAVKPGKAPGAFAHPTVTDVHPYVMLNYLGKPRDVMTLAHELGHGVHQVLAAD